MKKVLFSGIIVLAAAAVVFAGTLLLGTKREMENISSYADGMEKAQKITVKDAESLEEIADITGSTEIDEFVENLEMESWRLKDVPEDAEPDREYDFSQQKTLKAGETERGEELYPVCSLITYKDMLYMTISAGGISLDFEVPQSVQDYLESAEGEI